MNCVEAHASDRCQESTLTTGKHICTSGKAHFKGDDSTERRGFHALVAAGRPPLQLAAATMKTTTQAAPTLQRTVPPRTRAYARSGTTDGVTK